MSIRNAYACHYLYYPRQFFEHWHMTFKEPQKKNYFYLTTTSLPYCESNNGQHFMLAFGIVEWFCWARAGRPEMWCGLFLIREAKRPWRTNCERTRRQLENKTEKLLNKKVRKKNKCEDAKCTTTVDVIEMWGVIVVIYTLSICSDSNCWSFKVGNSNVTILLTVYISPIFIFDGGFLIITVGLSGLEMQK